MVTRRQFLERTGATGAAAVTWSADGLARVLEASAGVAGQHASVVANDEFYWREVQGAFTLDPDLSCAIGTVGIKGLSAGDITSKLWEKWRILATGIGGEGWQGIRVTPNVYTTMREIDVFVDAMQTLARA